MSRAAENTADYFPFFAKDGRTLFILQAKYGLEGIGFFTNLLRILCTTPGHILNLADPTEHLYVVSKIGINDETRADEMLDLMASTDKIDTELWHQKRVIYSEDFVNSLEELYRKRSNKPPTIEEIKNQYGIQKIHSGAETPHSGAETPITADIRRGNALKDADMPQRKEEDRKEEDRREERAQAREDRPVILPILKNWYKEYQIKSARLIQPSEDDRKLALSAMAQLNGDEDLAVVCVAYYWREWRNLFFAYKQSSRNKPAHQRESEWSFRGFAKNITSCIPPPTRVEETPIENPFEEEADVF